MTIAEIGLGSTILKKVKIVYTEEDQIVAVKASIVSGGEIVRITYDAKYDVLYLGIGEAKKVICKEIDEDVTPNIDTQGKLTGIEVLSDSENINLEQLL